MYKRKILLSMLASSILVAQTIELEQITVTSATNTSQSVEDVTSNVNVITSEEIKRKNYTTVVQALNSVSGINYTSNGGLGKSSSIYLRGFDSKRTLVLIDGIRYNDVAGVGGAPFGDLMISDIEQIEVIKGAQSGIWGADATAGVINIITKGAKKGVHTTINIEYGSFNTKKYGLSASYKAEDYYAKASVQKVDSDGFTTKAPSGEDIDNYEDDGYKNVTSNIKFGFDINDNNKIDLSHTNIYARSEYDNATPNDSDREIKTVDSFSSINFKHINDLTEVDIYAKLSIFDREDPFGWTTEFDGEVKEYGIKSNTAYNSDDFVVIGIDYKTFEHKNDLQEKYSNKAVFFTNSNEFNGFLGGKTIVTESLRFDDYDKFDDKATGKLGIKHFHKNIEGFVSSANIGSSYNVPTIYNLYNSFYGNPDLKPEETISYDVSLEYKGVKATYFSSTTKDMIDFNSGTWKYYNADGKTKIKGIELEYKTDVSDDLSVSSNYTWLDAKDSSGMKLQRRPRYTINVGADYYGIKDLHLGVYADYISERVEYTYGTYNVDAKTGKYAVVNFVANYDINKNFKAYAKVDNLFDRYYQTVDGFATAPLSAYVGIRAEF